MVKDLGSLVHLAIGRNLEDAPQPVAKPTLFVVRFVRCEMSTCAYVEKRLDTQAPPTPRRKKIACPRCQKPENCRKGGSSVARATT